jgi:hypothetical protein
LHSWQGATLALILVGVTLARWPRRRDLVLAPIALACVAPIAYQFALSKFDPAWKLAASLNNRPDLVVTTPQLAVLGPLLAAALFGAVRRRPRDDIDLMVLFWPLAALIVYRFDKQFPPHAMQGVTLPLSVLAVRGWPRGRMATALGLGALLIFTVPGLAYFAKSYRDVEPAGRELFFTPPREHAAFRFLERSSTPGAVLAPLPLALEVPAFTGREVWDGHQIWTPDPTRPQQVAAFYGGSLSGPQSIAFVRRAKVRFVIADCSSSTALRTKLAPVAAAVHAFGCVLVIEVR